MVSRRRRAIFKLWGGVLTRYALNATVSDFPLSTARPVSAITDTGDNTLGDPRGDLVEVDRFLPRSWAGRSLVADWVLVRIGERGNAAPNQNRAFAAFGLGIGASPRPNFRK